MGLKIRAGLAFGGLIMSYFFGLSGLSGIASHLDSTGNILVDIADGVGLVSKGIEALENWVDPNGIPSNDGTNLDQAQIPPIEPIPAEPPALKPAPTAAPAAKPVICKKGKCKPYDPTKDKVLQQQLIKAERERILQQIQSGALPADTAIPSAKLLDDDELDDDELSNALAKRLKIAQQIQPSKTTITTTKSKSGTTTSTTTGGGGGQQQPIKVELLNPIDPQIPSKTATNSPESSTSPVLSGWRYGAKRILGSFASVCQRLNQLLLKVVAKIFPWNRRARRRLTVGGGGGDDDEL